jgi:hypothetical protein
MWVDLFIVIPHEFDKSLHSIQGVYTKEILKHLSSPPLILSYTIDIVKHSKGSICVTKILGTVLWDEFLYIDWTIDIIVDRLSGNSNTV